MPARTFIEYITAMFPNCKRTINHFIDKGYAQPRTVVTGNLPLCNVGNITFSYIAETNELTLHDRGRVLFKGYIHSREEIANVVVNVANLSDILIPLCSERIDFFATEKGIRSRAFKEPFDCKRQGYYKRQKENKGIKTAGGRIKKRPCCPPPCAAHDSADTLIVKIERTTPIREKEKEYIGMNILLDTNGNIGAASYNRNYRGMNIREEIAACH